MKLVYINNILLPSEYAHSVQVMKMCEAFANNGEEVCLVVPNRKNRIKIDPFDYYGVKRNFKIKKLPCIDLFYGNASKLMYWLRFLSFYISVKVYLAVTYFDIVYTRDLYAALFLNNFYYEMHDFPKKSFVLRKLLKKAQKIFTTNNWKKQRLQETYPEYTEKIKVAPNAIDDALLQDNSVIRGISGKFIIGYFGSLKTKGMDKGIKDLLASMKFLSNDFLLYMVGGEAVDVEFYRGDAKKHNILDKIVFKERLPHKDVLKCMRGCDVLVAPFPKNEHYSYFMSPLKIFEYMASRKPIISTTLASIQEVLKHEYNALLIPPSDPKALAEAIERLRDDKELAGRISEQAYTDVAEYYTWDKRAKSIINFIQS